jgi:hypothetical protein
MNDIELLNRMADAIDEHGWTKHTVQDEQGHVCLFGAYLVARHGKVDYTVMELEEFKSLPPMLIDECLTALREAGEAVKYAAAWDSSHAGPILATFNDLASTTVEDVQLLIKRALHKTEPRR